MSTPVHKDWYPALAGALKKEGENGGAVFQLATLEGSNTPRVRSLVHREFLISNAFPNVPLIVSTTDIRTPKVSQMMNINQQVEAVYWTANTQEQFRITGKASVIPRPGYQSPYPSGTGPIFYELAQEGFDWEKKRVEVFDRMSGHMKASWCRPVPGSPLEGGYKEANKWPDKLPRLGEAESEDDKKNLEYALGNFALLLIEPFEVDFVELGTTPQKRTKFWREDAGSDEFKKTIVVP